MVVFSIIGIAATIVFALVGLYEVFNLVAPFVAGQAKSLVYRTQTYIQDLKNDADIRSQVRQERYEKKRQKDFEVEDSKLEIQIEKKNQELDKQIAALEELKESK